MAGDAAALAWAFPSHAKPIHLRNVNCSEGRTPYGSLGPHPRAWMCCISHPNSHLLAQLGQTHTHALNQRGHHPHCSSFPQRCPSCSAKPAKNQKGSGCSPSPRVVPIVGMLLLHRGFLYQRRTGSPFCPKQYCHFVQERTFWFFNSPPRCTRGALSKIR